MPTTTIYNRGAVVLLPFPFSDQSGFKLPHSKFAALILPLWTKTTFSPTRSVEEPVCSCPNRSARRTFGGVACARSPNGDFASGLDRGGRFDLFYTDAPAVGKDLVNISLFRCGFEVLRKAGGAGAASHKLQAGSCQERTFKFSGGQMRQRSAAGVVWLTLHGELNARNREANLGARGARPSREWPGENVFRVVPHPGGRARAGRMRSASRMHSMRRRSSAIVVLAMRY
jgi:hypothetical protein